MFEAEQVSLALDLLEIVELAWHESYGDITPTEEQVDDMLVLSEGTLSGLISAARLAVTDWRDLQVNAAAHRAGA